MASDGHYVERSLVSPFNESVSSEDKSSDTEESSSPTSPLNLARKKKSRKNIEQMIKDGGRRISTYCVTTHLLLRLAKRHQCYKLFALILQCRHKSDIKVPDVESFVAASLEEDWPTAEKLYLAVQDEMIAQIYGHKKQEKEKSTCDSDGNDIEWKERLWANSVVAPKVALELTESGMSVERIGFIFKRLRYDVNTIVDLKMPELTEAFLQHDRPVFSSVRDLEPIFQAFIEARDVRHLEVFLDYNLVLEDPLIMTQAYFKTLLDNMRHFHEPEVGDAFVRALTKRDFYNDGCLYRLEGILRKAGRRNLRLFLKYEEFRTTMMSRCNRDILAASFGANPSLLKNKVAVDARGSNARTPLHFAAYSCAARSVRFLLERGADPNALDEHGMTPLCLALRHPKARKCNDACIELLLKAGGHSVASYEEPYSWIHLVRVRRYQEVAERVVARLAIQDARGLSVEVALKAFTFMMNEGCWRCYERCRRQLARFKRQRIRDGRDFSMFQVIADEADRVAWRIDDKDRLVIESLVKQYKSEKFPYYSEIFKFRLSMIDRMRHFIERTKCILSECLHFADLDHLVIHKILKYLDCKDLLIRR